MPLLEKVINGSASPEKRSKALFVLAQSGSPPAREILGKIAAEAQEQTRTARKGSRITWDSSAVPEPGSS